MMKQNIKKAFWQSKHLSFPLTGKEWLNIFPEAFNYIQNKLIHLFNKRQQTLDRFKQLIKRQDLNLVEIILIRDTFKEQIKKIDKEIKKLKGYLTPEIQDAQFEINIKALKERINIIDIFEELYPDAKLHKTRRTIYTNCPFHDDKHPSFHMFPETQFFYCFGCGVKGDVVDLVKLSLNLSFKQAIEFLKNYKEEKI